MVSPVTNLQLISQTGSRQSTTHEFVFEFDLPTDPKVTAFELYISYDDPGHPEYVNLWIKEPYGTDPDYTVSVNNSTSKCSFSYQGTASDVGRKLYFTLVAVNTKWEKSSHSDPCLVYAFPSAPSNLFAGFDNFEVLLSWSPVDVEQSITGGVNSTFAAYKIYRYTTTVIPSSQVTLGTSTRELYHQGFTAGSYVWIIDTLRGAMWSTYLQASGMVELSVDIRMLEVFDLTPEYRPNLDNLLILVQDTSSETFLGYTTELEYVDTTCQKDTSYFYEVVSTDTNGQEGGSITYPVQTTPITKRRLILRSPGDSTNSLMYYPYWRLLKSCLIDSNYYNKTAYAIPYLKGGYIFRGYLGIRNAYVDIYVNGTYWNHVITNMVGAFEFVITLPKGTTELQLQARDYKNIGFSPTTSTINVTTVNIYTFFTVLGQEYEEMWTEATAQHSDFSFTSGRPESLEKKFESWLDIQRDVSETVDNYTGLMNQILLAYEYGGVEAGLYQVLDAFNTYAENFDHYELYFSNSLWDTKQSGHSFVVATSTGFYGIERDNYIYGVTSLNDDDEETAPILLRIDSRWWPIGKEDWSYHYFNAFKWATSDTRRYNIYRYQGSVDNFSYDNLYYLCTVERNMFVDTGYIATTTTKTPLTATITENFPPLSIEHIIRTRVTDRTNALKKKTWIVILLFAKNNTDIPAFQLSRLRSILADLTPPEIGLTIYYCNDSKSEILL